MDQKTWIGKRVRIMKDCREIPRADNRSGTIVRFKRIGSTDSPIIKLDNGDEIGGWQCWWDLEKARLQN